MKPTDVCFLKVKIHSKEDANIILWIWTVVAIVCIEKSSTKLEISYYATMTCVSFGCKNDHVILINRQSLRKLLQWLYRLMPEIVHVHRQKIVLNILYELVFPFHNKLSVNCIKERMCSHCASLDVNSFHMYITHQGAWTVHRDRFSVI